MRYRTNEDISSSTAKSTKKRYRTDTEQFEGVSSKQAETAKNIVQGFIPGNTTSLVKGIEQATGADLSGLRKATAVMDFVPSKLDTGFLGAAEGITDFLAGGATQLVGQKEAAKWIYEHSWSRDLSGSDVVDAEIGNESKGYQLASDLISGVGNVGFQVAVGTLIGGALAAPVANGAISQAGARAISFAPLFASASGSGTAENIAKTGELGWRENVGGLLKGGVEVLTEVVSPTGKIVDRAINGKSAGSIFRYLSKHAVAKNIIVDFASEAGEEMASYAGGWFIENKLKISDEAFSARDMVYQGVLGGITGAIFAAPSDISLVRSARSSGAKVYAQGDAAVNNKINEGLIEVKLLKERGLNNDNVQLAEAALAKLTTDENLSQTTKEYYLGLAEQMVLKQNLSDQYNALAKELVAKAKADPATAQSMADAFNALVNEAGGEGKYTAADFTNENSEAARIYVVAQMASNWLSRSYAQTAMDDILRRKAALYQGTAEQKNSIRSMEDGSTVAFRVGNNAYAVVTKRAGTDTYSVGFTTPGQVESDGAVYATHNLSADKVGELLSKPMTEQQIDAGVVENLAKKAQAEVEKEQKAEKKQAKAETKKKPAAKTTATETTEAEGKAKPEQTAKKTEAKTEQKQEARQSEKKTEAKTKATEETAKTDTKKTANPKQAHKEKSQTTKAESRKRALALRKAATQVLNMWKKDTAHFPLSIAVEKNGKHYLTGKYFAIVMNEESDFLYPAKIDVDIGGRNNSEIFGRDAAISSLKELGKVERAGGVFDRIQNAIDGATSVKANAEDVLNAVNNGDGNGVELYDGKGKAKKVGFVKIDGVSFNQDYVRSVLSAIENPTLFIGKMDKSPCLVIKGDNGSGMVLPTRISGYGEIVAEQIEANGYVYTDGSKSISYSPATITESAQTEQTTEQTTQQAQTETTEKKVKPEDLSTVEKRLASAFGIDSSEFTKEEWTKARECVPNIDGLGVREQARVLTLIRTAQAHGINEDYMKGLARLSSVYGFGVVFEDIDVAGFYSRKNGMVVINPKNLDETYGHEIKHTFDQVVKEGNAEFREDLSAKVKKIVGSSVFEKAKAQYKADYEKLRARDGSVAEMSDAELDAEASANVVGKYLSNMTLLKKIAATDYSLGRGLLAAIRRMKDKWTSAKAFAKENDSTAFAEYRKMTRIERMLMDELNKRKIPVYPIGDFDVSYSVSEWERMKGNHAEYLSKKGIKVDLTAAHRMIDTIVEEMRQYAEILPQDRIGKTLVGNASYGLSVENTTICPRTLSYNEFTDKVQAKLGRPLTQMESFLASQMLYEIATDPQCLYCYVALDRKAYNEYLLRYFERRDAVIKEYREMTDKSDEAVFGKIKRDKNGNPVIGKRGHQLREGGLYAKFLGNSIDTENMEIRFRNWIGLADSGETLLTPEDVATEERKARLKNDPASALGEQFADAHAYAQGASQAKVQHDYVAYFDEILKLSDRTIKKLNKHYGLRWYSFSDYSGAFIAENMQQVTDAAIRGLKGLAYTKDTDFAAIFAPTGMGINISVFVTKDENGNFVIDEKQSANLDEAIKLRNNPNYKNVGIVVTAATDDAVVWAMQQEWSDVVIPFHIVRTGQEVAEFYKWMNYTHESGDTVRDQELWDSYQRMVGSKRASKLIYPSEHNNDYATYMRLCAERGLKPRFERFANMDGVTPEQYMKLVNETRLPASKTTPLKAEFDLDAAKASFQKFVDKGGYWGSWYKDDADVEASAERVAQDVRAGKKANEVEYGRQDKFNPEAIMRARKKVRQHGTGVSDTSLSPAPANTSGRVVTQAKPPRQTITEKITNAKGQLNRQGLRNALKEAGSVVEGVKVLTVNAQQAVENQLVLMGMTKSQAGAVMQYARSARSHSLNAAQFKLADMTGEIRSDGFLKIIEPYLAKKGEVYDAVDQKTGETKQYTAKGGEMAGKLYDEFQDYYAMLHALDREAVGKNPYSGMSVDEMKAWVEKHEKAHPDFKAAAEKLSAFNAALLDIEAQAGIRSQETVDLWKKQYPHYVPMYVQEDGTIGRAPVRGSRNMEVRRDNAVATESNHRVSDALQNYLNQLQRRIRAAKFNLVLQEVYNSADGVSYEQVGDKKVWSVRYLEIGKDGKEQIVEVGGFKSKKEAQIEYLKHQDSRVNKNVVRGDIAEFAARDLREQESAYLDNPETENDPVEAFRKVQKGRQTVNEVSFYMDGKRVTMAVSDRIYTGLADLSGVHSSVLDLGIVKFVSKINDTFKKLVTNWNPFFAVKNIARDLQDGLLNSKFGMGEFLNMYRKNAEMMATGKYNKEWELFIANGCLEASIFSDEFNTLVKSGKSGLEQATGVVGQFQHIKNFNTLTEALPRFTEFCLTLKHGGTIQQAIYNAADVTVNFSRSGVLTRILNKTVSPFLNPAVQGLDRVIRLFTEDGIKNNKALASLLLKAVLLAIVPMALGNAMYGNDDEYKDMKDSIKENNYLFKIGDTWLKLPRGRVVSTISGLFNRSYKQLTGQETDWGDYGKNVLDQITPAQNVARHIGSPFMDVANNRTWYGTKIESDALQNYAVNQRYDENTSRISVWIGQLTSHFGLSPKEVNYLIDQYTGVVGDILLPTTTPAGTKGVVSYNFTVDPNTSSNLSNRFYDLYNKTMYKSNDGDVEAYYLKKRLDETKSAVSELFKQIKTINASSELSNKEKVKQASAIRATINQLYKTALDDRRLYEQNIKDALAIENSYAVEKITAQSAKRYGLDSDAVGKYALTFGGDFVKKYDTEAEANAYKGDASKKTVYAEANRLTYGAEYALREYSSTVYEKAQKLNELGISYDEYYNYYMTARYYSGKTKKDKILAYLNGSGLSKSQIALMMYYSGYSAYSDEAKKAIKASSLSAERKKELLAGITN